MLRVNDIKISGIGGINEISLSFNDRFNIICGPNGVGKTTILECIPHTFSQSYNNIITRNARSEKGHWELKGIAKDGEMIHHSVYKSYFHPYDNLYDEHKNFVPNYASEIIVFKTNRNFAHTSIQAVQRDLKDQTDSDAAANGVTYGNSKHWFINRFMFSAHNGQLSKVQEKNLETAKWLFGALDPNVNYHRVKIETFDVLLKTSDGSEIYFEYLSSGYKSVIYLLLGLMKEIEYRFTDPQICIQEFDGIIIIDELDLHLHPQWQAKFIFMLKELLPKAQFITSTHSPHMIQVANPNEIIPLGFSVDGRVELRKVPSGAFGFQGWSIEEILVDVMGMEKTNSQTYLDALKNFELALDKECHSEATVAYEILDQMLHPNNHLRKLLKLQLSSLGGYHD
ncbi:AAA family ATPase [Paenibacillus sp. SYP-B4298]|uniref:AAA family ATPase n=1 Tax=Paenibacillus sp. SYP-B4298 TaxID=2996034 RepID=UPI0022DDC0B2|nr:AAA family ATPase [Paenibacillus sp. SYP-B4298]